MGFSGWPSMNKKVNFSFFLLHFRMDGLRADDLTQLLQDGFVLLTGGRDQRGGPLLCFPATPRRDRAKPEDIRRILSYLFTLPRYIN